MKQLRLLAKQGKAEDRLVARVQRSMNMRSAATNLFVYSTLADFNIVGGETLQLLRAIPIKDNGPRFEPVVERFDSPHYVPLLPSLIDTFEITIATDTGETAHFEIGKTLVKLHFRPQRLYE